jgi:serine/threonine protein kinase
MEILGQLKYQRIRQIGVGQGRNSEVFEATDLHLGGTIAVKEIPRSKFLNPADYFAEAQAMFASSHPKNVVPIRYACDCPSVDRICLAMPFYKNGSLHTRIASGPLPLREALRVGLGVLHGLSAIHRVRYLHLDLKPSNVLFSDTDEPMVADFGQTRQLTPATGTVGLPPLYPDGLPPEFYTTGIGTIETDVYHAGLLMYRAVNGDQCFDQQRPTSDLERQCRIIAGQFPDQDIFLPHVPRTLRTAIRKALACNPADRFPSATTFADALAAVSVPLNWETTCAAADEIEWRARRDGQPDLLVRLSGSGRNNWRIEQFTRNGGSIRARKRSGWQSGLTRDMAIGQLRRLFHQMAKE